jgi:hypothetical protein
MHEWTEQMIRLSVANMALKTFSMTGIQTNMFLERERFKLVERVCHDGTTLSHVDKSMTFLAF